MKKIFILLLVLSFSLILNSQSIINVETMRLSFDTTKRWIGSVEVGGLYQSEKINENKILINSTSRLGYRIKNTTFLFLGNLYFEKAGDVDIENKFNFHLRYNYKFSEKLYFEAFGQLQHNKQIELTKRDLLGLGLRYIVLNKDKFKLNVGSLMMYEHEVISDSITYNYYTKNSTYLFLGYFINSDLSILSTTYYQPLLTNFSNFRVFSELSLDVSINKFFSIVNSYTIYYDTQLKKDVPLLLMPTRLFMLSFKFKF